MSARATLNKLEPQINVLSDTLQDVKMSLGEMSLDVQDGVDAQERLQNRLDVVEEEMLSLKVQRVDLIKHLNTAIKRINDIHQWLKDNLPCLQDVTVDDLHCHEEFDFGELSDNE